MKLRTFLVWCFSYECLYLLRIHLKGTFLVENNRNNGPFNKSTSNDRRQLNKKNNTNHWSAGVFFFSLLTLLIWGLCIMRLSERAASLDSNVGDGNDSKAAAALIKRKHCVMKGSEPPLAIHTQWWYCWHSLWIIMTPWPEEHRLDIWNGDTYSNNKFSHALWWRARFGLINNGIL